MRGRQERRCKQLLGNLKEEQGYCKLREEAPDHSLRRTRFGRSCGLLLKELTE
jgi:hypothetical protein